MSAAELAPKGTQKREFLQRIQQEIQQLWANQNIYQSQVDLSRPKFFVTFPYPYMNGRLHLGHAYSFSKCDFTARFQRMMGKNTLLPLSFHCTGMPVPACADRLSRELREPEQVKQKKEMSQFQNLERMGVPIQEIPRFTDAQYWLEYFPPIARADMMRLGAAIDWRRSFITTDKNPYYDSFVRWQFEHLKESGHLKFGKRHSIYSIKDGQPCMDHERTSGENVNPQEYTLIKIQLIENLIEKLQPFADKKIFVVAATLRPETMYGQTNCFILPTGMYGVFQMPKNQIFICSQQSMKNMAYQEITASFGEYIKLMELEGSQLIGSALKAPLTSYQKVYLLPMMGISMKKGTGIVTSVPSDAPHDYAALRDLQNKPAFRQKYGLTEEMVNFQVIPIIDIPELGTTAAVGLCQQLKIQSQNDHQLLNQAKDKVYLKGFNQGILIIGPHSGKPVQVAKPLVRQDMIDKGEAISYYQPEKPVRSRSGQDCIVALCDQWYLNYGQQVWREEVHKHVMSNFQTYTTAVHKEFEYTLDWLKEWACSRTYGLGTQLPNDPKYVIESLSDSTIYMAYYTVAHQIQGGVLDGSQVGPSGIRPEQLSCEVWDYIFTLREDMPQTDIQPQVLSRLRAEFSYWYPLDLRCSAKDLIRNHLTMSLYNHACIWKNKPELWPRGFFCNGYTLLNGDKMSKNTGNYLTMKEAIDSFGADATRVALADSGDTLQDGNFVKSTADNAILKLHALYSYISQHLKSLDQNRIGEKTFFDNLFQNTLNATIQRSKKSYESMQYREALKICFYELPSQKQEYKILSGNSMHKELVLKFIQVQILLLAPLTPHFAQYVWKIINETLGRPPSLVVNQLYPQQNCPIDLILERQFVYIKALMRNARAAKDKGRKNSKLTPKKLVIYIAREYPDLNKQVLEILNRAYAPNPVPSNKDHIGGIKQLGLNKGEMQKMMQFSGFKIKEFSEMGPEAFEVNLPFDEHMVVGVISDHMQNELALEEILIMDNSEQFAEDKTSMRNMAIPGAPQFFFYDLK